jgi:hypothetical protein
LKILSDEFILEGMKRLAIRKGKLRLDSPIEFIPHDSATQQSWIDQGLASGPPHQKNEAEWQSLKRRVLARRK